MSTTLFDSVVTEVYDFEGDGTAVKDGSHDLTEVNTPTYGSTSPPQGSQYADLDETTDEHYTLADDPDFDADDGDYTIAFWVNSAVNTPQIATKGGLFGSNGWNVLGEYVSGSDYDIAIKHRNGGINYWCYSGFHISANKNTWFHVVASYDQSVGEITWWVSDTTTFGSELSASAVAIGAAAPANSNTMYIGGTSATDTLDGALDEFAWFKGYAVNATEAQEIYNGAGSGGWREAAGGADVRNHIIPAYMRMNR